MQSDFIDVKSFYSPGTDTKHTGLIPRRVLQTWKTSLFDKAHADRLMAFRQKYLNFSFEFYDDNDMDEYMHARWSRHPIFKVYKNCVWGASRADIWRYCILYDKGGIYLDIDSSIEFDLNGIPDNVREIISFEGNNIRQHFGAPGLPGYSFFEQSNFVEPSLEFKDSLALQWCLVMAPQHPLLKIAIDLIVYDADFYYGKVFSAVTIPVLYMAGPVLFTRATWTYVKSGAQICQSGHDFYGQATFKNVPDNNKGVYAEASSSHYAMKRDAMVLAEALRLNLGCGDDLKCGYVNIDLHTSSEFVVAMDIRDLDFAANSVDEIYAKDVLEHVGLPDAMKCLANWAKVLKPGGTLMIQTPCLTLMIEALKNGHLALEQINYFLFAGVRHLDGRSEWCSPAVRDSDWHKSVYTEQFLAQVLAANGLEVVTTILDTPGRAPRPATNIKIIARKR